MRTLIHDKKYNFKYIFDTETGAYIRTGILDENGKDTGIDPFMASYPHLIDVGIMGHCIHGKTGLCAKAGIGCYQSGMLVEQPNMTVEDFARLPSKANTNAISLLLADEVTLTSMSNLRKFLKFAERIVLCRISRHQVMA